MQNLAKAMRNRMDRINTEYALRHLDNHLLRDIGLPERDRRHPFGPF